MVTFLPFDKKIEADGTQTILELARRLGLPLESACGGKKKCGKCRIVVEKTTSPLAPPSEREAESLGKLLQKGYRLACETTVSGEAVIRIPEESLTRRQVVLTSGPEHRLPARLRPNVRPYAVEVPPPVLGSPRADRERFLAALKEVHGIGPLSLDSLVLQRLPHLLRSDEGVVTAVVRDGREVVDLQRGRADSLLGIAFDVGTTTVVAYLMDLSTGEKLAVKSALNPQVVFGADVVRRVSLCQEEPDGLERLCSMIVECLNGLVDECCVEGGAEPGRIVEATAVGNTVMHHLLLGLDPRYLATAPYVPVLKAAQDVKARTVGLRIAPSACLHLPPLQAGFVGSDTIACILSTGLHKSRIPTLLIDLGTNGEIVMGNRDRLVCCSTAAGPAFEGGHIRFGMRAASGAIDRVEIDPGTWEVRVQTIDRARPVGICGSGILSAVAEMIRKGIVLERGSFNEAVRSPRLRREEDGWEFVLAWASETGIDQDIVVTRRDVSELQLAKSAVHAGASVLQEVLGVPFRRVLLAGACGNYLDPRDALAIGLIPEVPDARIQGVGNAAGQGSCLTLLDSRMRREAERIAATMEYQELAGLSRFGDLFVPGMFFPQARGRRPVS